MFLFSNYATFLEYFNILEKNENNFLKVLGIVTDINQIKILLLIS